MRSMALRWLVVVLMLGVVVALAFQRYQNEVAYLVPAELGKVAEAQTVRVLGRVQAGSFKPAAAEAHFVLEGQGAVVNVIYRGPDVDTLRELKTILARGVKQADGSLLADQVSIAPNYDYIAGAYGAAGLILLAFAFLVERRVRRMQSALGGTLEKEMDAL